MVETAGLENRYAGNGIEGSNPSLSALVSSRVTASRPPPPPWGTMPLITAVVLAQYGTSPGSVCLTGVCGLMRRLPDVPPGIYFVGLALILAGIVGLRRMRT